MTMTTITLNRTGDVPLTFEGEELAEATSWRREGLGESRFHELKLYRTAAGNYVVAIVYRSRWQDDQPWFVALHAGDAAAVRAAIRAHDPVPPALAAELEATAGAPNRRDHVIDLRRRLSDLEVRYQVAVADLFHDTGIEFAETLA